MCKVEFGSSQHTLLFLYILLVHLAVWHGAIHLSLLVVLHVPNPKKKTHASHVAAALTAYVFPARNPF